MTALAEFLEAVAGRVVVIGSATRSRNPRDLDLLWDGDSPRAFEAIDREITDRGLVFESAIPGSWSIMFPEIMVELLPFHRGPSYRTVRRRAEPMRLEAAANVELMVAQPEDAG